MKQLLSFLLAIVILSQPCSKIWIYFSFKINQEYIANTLCEKRQLKENCCQGSCKLKEKLSKADNEEKSPSPSISKEKMETFYCIGKVPFSFLHRDEYPEMKVFSMIMNNFYYSLFMQDIFHPPKLA